MSTLPEYGEEVLIEELEDSESEHAAHGPLPPYEDITEALAAEQREAEEETHHPPAG